MRTIHRVYFKDSSDMCELDSNSIDLMITSPPYPMIEMWDQLFSSLNTQIKTALDGGEGKKAFNLMHEELDKTWRELERVLKLGGIACVNIGDATRKIGNNFQLFPNHVRIASFFYKNNFVELPCVIWRKPTNSPNKYLGSGMLPPNAYVTLEHEYILIYRKGNVKRRIEPKSEQRYNSAFFWEERNKWFSDIWNDIRGVSQKLKKNDSNQNKIRDRTAAFPLEIPYRLINMFSIYGDKVLDPFWGTGTSSLAAMISSRNSIAYEINPEFMESFKEKIKNVIKLNNDTNISRLSQHIEFVDKYKKKAKDVKYNAVNYNFPVITKQEVDILFYNVINYIQDNNEFILEHEEFEFDNNIKFLE